MAELNDAEFAAQKARLEKLVDKWYQAMELAHYRTNIIYFRSEGPIDNDGSNFQTYASTQARWEYRKATIYFYLACFVDLSDRQAEAMVVHELVHLMLKEMDYYRDEHGRFHNEHLEHVTESIARALIYVREIGEGKRDQFGWINGDTTNKRADSLCEGESK